ncbi:SAM hydrolase/SAM-dependent halogenase family protein [Salinactinospora qingdaonensis]|uniref:SAM-dependent chlorinase/fluorinase n=1 Tax=Salinactinospora qingdaonensis TaxID=702744 RepID=A0ABP7FFN9_9ACTN
MPERDWITFLTDYGTADGFVGICHGVMARIAPQARVLDLTHLVPPGDIGHGAEALRQAIAYLPEAVHLAVVDPGVGTSRRPVVLSAGGHLLVGPDNGLLVRAADEVGGVDSAHELSEPRYALGAVSHTFHGRDIFAPAAAHLATGLAPGELGPEVPVADLVRLPEPIARREGEEIHGEIVFADRFGNLQSSLPADLVAQSGLSVGTRLEVTAKGSTVTLPFVTTFADVAEGEPLAHVDSADRLALAVNRGSAATALDLGEGDRFTLRAR